MKRLALDGHIRIERRPGYVFVWHGRSAQDLDEATIVLDAMDAALEDWSADRLLFDSRTADATPPEVGKRIWGWLADHPRLRKVATLVESPERADRINTGLIGEGVRIRAFHDEAPAVRWLTILR